MAFWEKIKGNDGREVSFKAAIENLSPAREVEHELSRFKELEKLYGFITMGEGTDADIMLANLAYMCADKGHLVCVADGKLFYPSIYKYFGCEPNKAQHGLYNLIASDRYSARECIIPTGHKNIYMLSGSPFDDEKYYNELKQEYVVHMCNQLKACFDIILIQLSNWPVEAFNAWVMKECDRGYLIWGERLDSPQNTRKFLRFMTRINVPVAKFNNVIYNNKTSLVCDYGITGQLGLKPLAEIPYVASVYEYANNAKPYMTSPVIDKRYYRALEKIYSDIARGRD